MHEQTASDDTLTRAVDEQPVIRLSPVQEADYLVLYDWLSDLSELHLWTDVRKLMSREEFIADIKQRMQNSLIMVVRDGASQAPMGVLQLFEVALREGTASFLIYMDKRWRSLGYGFLATAEFLSYVFTNYPLRKVYADVYGFNERSALLLLAAGFQPEGRLRKHLWWQDRYWDLVKYAMTREAFESGAQYLLGPWAARDWPEVPEGFTRAEAQRIFLALVNLPLPDERPPARAPDDDDEAKPAVQERQEDSSTSAARLSTPEEIDEYIDLAYSKREKIAVNWGLAGFAA